MSIVVLVDDTLPRWTVTPDVNSATDHWTVTAPMVPRRLNVTVVASVNCPEI